MILKKRQSITLRFFVYIIITILMSNILLFFVNYTVMRKTLVKRGIESSQYMLENNLMVMDQYFGDIDHIAESIIFNPELINVLKSPSDSVAGLNLLRSIERMYYHSREDLHLTFYKAKAPKNVYSIYLSNEYAQAEDYRNSKWYKQMEEVNEDRVIITNIYSNYPEGIDNAFVHSIVYRIRDAYGDKVVGYLRIDLDLKLLKNQLILGYTGIEAMSILSNEDDILFFDKEPIVLPMNIKKKKIASGKVQHYQNKSQIISYGISKTTDWTLVLSVSKSSLYEDVGYLGLTFTIALLGAMTMAAIICFKFFTVITRNFKRLMKGMNAVKSGNFQTRVEPMKDDEIGRLVHEFNDMVKRIDELMIKVEKNQELLNEAEIKALQQQINPHFIYNTLEMIMGLAAEEMVDEIIEVSSCMSAMLRYNTKMESRTTIEQELRQVRNFVRVLQLRFEGCFQVYYNIDETCLNGIIVKFALQPLVENAISHGLSNTTEGGKLIVEVQRIEHIVEIKIEDNGSGILPYKLKEINERVNYMEEDPLRFMDQHDGTGLMNVHLRLKLFFGESYHISIESSQGKGTRIRLRLPYVESGDDLCTEL